MPPLAFTVATAVFELLHVPPSLAFSNCVCEPAHTLVVPVIAPSEASAVKVTTLDVVAEHGAVPLTMHRY
jgi:hypothetical protein